MSSPDILTCGACSLCCRLIEVTELSKPRDTWCPHCDKAGGGCTIFGSPARPAACSEWQCVWLQSQSNSDQDKRLPPGLRPDRTHVVLTPGTDGKAIVAHVDKVYPDAWKEGEMGRFIRALIQHSPDPVIIRVGDRRTAWLDHNDDRSREFVEFIDEGGK